MALIVVALLFLPTLQRACVLPAGSDLCFLSDPASPSQSRPIRGTCVSEVAPVASAMAGAALPFGVALALESAVPSAVAPANAGAVGVSGWGWAAAAGLAVLAAAVAVVGLLAGAVVGWVLAYGFWQSLMAQAASDRAAAQQQVGRLKRAYELEVAERRRRMVASEMPVSEREQAVVTGDFYESLAGIYPQETIAAMKAADDRGRHGALEPAGVSAPEGT